MTLASRTNNYYWPKRNATVRIAPDGISLEEFLYNVMEQSNSCYFGKDSSYRCRCIEYEFEVCNRIHYLYYAHKLASTIVLNSSQKILIKSTLEDLGISVVFLKFTEE